MSDRELTERLNEIATRAKAERNLDKLALLGIDAIEVIKPVHPTIVEMAQELFGQSAPEWFVRPRLGQGPSPVEIIARGDAQGLNTALVFAKIVPTMGT